jgi:ribosomal protein L11 methyltransferase
VAERWLQARLEVRRDQVPAAESLLERCGSLVSWTEGADDELVLEPAPGTTPLWQLVGVTGLLPADTPVELVTLAAAATLPEAAHTLTFSTVDDKDWDAEWRRSLKPLRFGSGFWVCPEGQPCPDPDGRFIVLEPGLAFGTGTHPTTAMCLAWLSNEALLGDTVLDYGCGSGILAVAALTLGAPRATAVDIDPQALLATEANGRRNGCSERLQIMPADELAAGETYGVILANILSGTLIRLAGTLCRHGRPGTRLALSGILAEQADDVRSAYRDLAVLEVAHRQDGWVLLTGHLR